MANRSAHRQQLKLTMFITAAGSTCPGSVSALGKYAFKIAPIMTQHNKDAILQVPITLWTWQHKC